MFSNKKKSYINSVNAKGIFDNTFETAYPQTVVAEVILNHFKKSSKKPKCLYIGWDGCRTDAMKYIVKSDDEKISGYNDAAFFSAVNCVKKCGGLYTAYVGGEPSAPQETSTAQGWATALCGKWMKKQWRYGIEWSLDDDYPTVMKVLANQNYKSSFTAIWPVHFDNTYLNEINYAEKESLPMYYYKAETDLELHGILLERINSSDDFIFGIYEYPDENGHGTGFGDDNYRYVAGICSLDRLSYLLLEEIKKRKSFDEEDWLIVIGSDHGGHLTRHGTQRIEDRGAFLALSKPIESLRND